MSGALIEREIPSQFRNKREISINLRQPDFKTALHLGSTVNSALGERLATPLDVGTFTVEIHPTEAGDIVGLVASTEKLGVTLDQVAKVVLGERTGTVVIGEDVRISAGPSDAAG